MKKIIRKLALYCIAALALSSCEKDNITTTAEELSASEKRIETELRRNLGSAPNGWVMMVKSSLSDSAYIPVVMKFDTAKYTVQMKSIYGTAVHNTSTYLINKGVSGILLNFSGGSIISSLMRLGAKYGDVTDYIFKVMAITPESITIQCLKSGARSTPEGGVVYTLFKRPDNWIWADDPILLDMRTAQARANITNTRAVMTLEYARTQKTVHYGYVFITNYDTVLASYQRVDEIYTNASAMVYDKFYIFGTSVIYNNNGTIQSAPYSETPVARQGHNALNYIPFTGNAGTNAANGRYVGVINTPYLVINEVTRSGRNVTIKLAAYDKEGKDYIRAEYRNYNR